MAQISALSHGTTLKGNTYRVERLLGKGGFGHVYLATDLIIQKPCAIKENFDTSPGAQGQFEIEARILANLSHPHLVRVTDSFVEPSGKMYMVMEYVEGEDLSDALDRSGPLPEDKVLAWMEPIFEAVEYLHTYQPRPVIHRDIKPANIRLRKSDGKAILVDFGIAKIGGKTDKTRVAAQAYSARTARRGN
jgi:serine/threonine protein kinase